MRNNMPAVYRIQQDIYWHKVLQLCDVSTAMIRCYESKKDSLSHGDWIEFVRVFENLVSKVNRVILKHGILVGVFDEDLEELEKMREKIAAVLLVTNKKLDRSGVCF
jgi:hypothetical protein